MGECNQFPVFEVIGRLRRSSWSFNEARQTGLRPRCHYGRTPKGIQMPCGSMNTSVMFAR